uniref:Polygalacturonase-like n=1 Tax=Nicotiana tabacum TaxID=4097 RepID=A0A1S4BRP6_TOBAC|nr:PREDICTED: polygalacturonase-like [Nicotiana tabacum]
MVAKGGGQQLQRQWWRRTTAPTTGLAAAPWKNLGVVGKLPQLEALQLFDAGIGKEWEVVEEGFPQLKFLQLKFLEIRFNMTLKKTTEVLLRSVSVRHVQSNIYFGNSAQTHILIEKCNGFKVDSVMIESPGNSPNTDGIHIQSSQYVAITNSKISTGDDCISIGDYSSNVQRYNIQCGPGHGIRLSSHRCFAFLQPTGLTNPDIYRFLSSKSVGKGGNFAQVENIHVSNAFFYGTTNGARIKTWQVGRGYVRDVIFENLEFNSVKNPIIIDQNYCDVRGACKEMVIGVQISNVIYQNIFGTPSTAIAIKLNRSMSVPCIDITMQLIQLTSATAGTATPLLTVGMLMAKNIVLNLVLVSQNIEIFTLSQHLHDSANTNRQQFFVVCITRKGKEKTNKMKQTCQCCSTVLLYIQIFVLALI